MKIPLDKLTNHVQQALNVAVAEAVRNRLPAVTPEVLLLCLLEQKNSAAARLIPSSRHSLIRERIESQKSQSSVNHPPIAPLTTLMIEEAVLTALEFSTPFVSTEHVFLAMLRNPEVNIGELLSMPSAMLQDIETTIVDHLTQTGELWDKNMKSAPDSLDFPSVNGVDELERPGSANLFGRYAKELTASDADLSPVIGRAEEINRLGEILSRKTKNNPLLIGDAGVGKTAIVEGLAQQISAGTCSPALADKKIYALDISALVAGTMFRGEFESRLKNLLAELKKNSESIIFIDEIHTIMGAGSTHGSLDLANILKPALARGEIRCIGATTFAEYQKHIKGDGALDRRFQPISVDEPSREETVSMLMGLRHHYSEFHGIQINAPIIDAIVDLAHRYMPHRKFPDKAIDVLDEACAAVKLRQPVGENARAISQTEKTIQRLTEQKERSIFFENLAQAERISEKINEIEKKLLSLRQSVKKARKLPALAIEDVALTISKQQHVPFNHILQTAHVRPVAFNELLAEHIVGQHEAVARIGELLTKAHLGLSAPEKPQSSMLFVGPSGVGKTFAAQAIASAFFGSEQALLKLDMADFTERHHVSKLTGAPAGYVGYREESMFHQLLKRPGSVVLFDEIDKAHPDVMNILLNILDTGLLTDASGQQINFRHAIVILTSNQPVAGIIGFGGSNPSATGESLKKVLRNELIHRLQSVISFSALSTDSLAALALKELGLASARLSQKNIDLKFNDAFGLEIARRAETAGGVRALKNIIDREIMNGVTKALNQKTKRKSIRLMLAKEPITQ